MTTDTSQHQKWNLSELLDTLHTRIQGELQACRVLAHPTDKGDASEDVWLKLMQDYLPQRYRAEKAHVVDSNGEFSEQIDIVIFDRQYTPLIFELRGSMIVPAESVYAVFEVKQTANKAHIEYAKKKIASVKALHRTSAPIRHLTGKNQKALFSIQGGLLVFKGNIQPDTLQSYLEKDPLRLINIGCVASNHGTNKPAGYFLAPAIETDNPSNIAPCEFYPHPKAATAFLFKLIGLLQTLGTVPAIDMDKYAEKLI